MVPIRTVQIVPFGLTAQPSGAFVGTQVVAVALYSAGTTSVSEATAAPMAKMIANALNAIFTFFMIF